MTTMSEDGIIGQARDLARQLGHAAVVYRNNRAGGDLGECLVRDSYHERPAGHELVCWVSVTGLVRKAGSWAK